MNEWLPLTHSLLSLFYFVRARSLFLLYCSGPPTQRGSGRSTILANSATSPASHHISPRAFCSNIPATLAGITPCSRVHSTLNTTHGQRQAHPVFAEIAARRIQYTAAIPAQGRMLHPGPNEYGRGISGWTTIADGSRNALVRLFSTHRSLSLSLIELDAKLDSA